MFPFGNGSILTVDLGQQYVDFFSFYKRTINTLNFGNLFYSFSNGYGGEMTSIWSYYLMSPLNLIIAILPKSFMNGSIMLITLLKYGLSGLSFGYLIKTKKVKNNLTIPIFATSYAMNGWIIANQLNIIWLDAMIILPIIILGIDNIIKKNSYKVYLISLTAIIIINYYMAFMICIFSCTYFIANYVIKYSNINNKIKMILKYIGTSLTAFLISSWLMIPNIIALKDGKGQYTISNIKWKFEYNPLDMISKSLNGAFNFDQIPSGYPNIFIGSIALISMISFFFNHNIRIKKRVIYFLLLSFLIISMSFEPLDLLWHAFQFPVWYPYRFSFITCFLIAYLGAIGFNSLPKEINITLIIKVSVILVAGMLYVGVNINRFTFLSIEKYIISLLILAITFLIIMLINKKTFKYYLLSLLIITICDMGINTFNSLNSISYVNNSDYTTYNKILSNKISSIQKNDNSFYRIGKSFYRTKNDPLENNFNGGSVFSSTLQKKNTEFESKIGIPFNSGSIDYSNGTLFTDSLLSFKYIINMDNGFKKYPMIQQSGKRYDVINNKVNNDFNSYKNNNYFPIIYETNQNSLKKIKTNDDPLNYQNNIFKSLSNSNKNIFNFNNDYKVTFNNVYNTKSLNKSVVKKKNLLKPASIDIKYNYTDGNIPYLLLSGNFNKDNCSIFVNGNSVIVPKTFSNSIVISLPKQNSTIDINFKKASLYSNDFGLYNLNYNQFKKDTNYIHNQRNNIKFNNNNISADLNFNKKGNILTSIPYSMGWHLVIDGHESKISPWLNEFIGSSKMVSRGKHKVFLYYYPSGLNIGIIMTIIGISILLVNLIINKKKYK
ncbi:YfhO family protein [Apilactobacillus apisilvae]|uniref:YfhO family protein n=2 Tax=Apilactobacillus apisilvae TaxID=2923364 RepID=A0ABY4PIK6_9LACO|nr:YfhO family protein [Apilactobacillus apisilvae]